MRQNCVQDFENCAQDTRVIENAARPVVSVEVAFVRLTLTATSEPA